jgi:hypothetical protein
VLIIEIDQIFVTFHVHTKEAVLFFKHVSFSAWLAGRFYNFKRTQNREKKEEMAQCDCPSSGFSTRYTITHHVCISGGYIYKTSGT